eukprot:gene19565-26247_t
MRASNALAKLKCIDVPYIYETLQSNDLFEAIMVGIKARDVHIVVDHVCPYNQSVLKSNGFALYTFGPKVVIALDNNAFMTTVFYKTGTFAPL